MLNSATKEPAFDHILSAAERVTWRVDDLIGGDKQLDFERRFLPENLARVEPLEFLSARERRILNQLRGHGYLYMFGLVEEFILPFVLDHARPVLHDDVMKTRAYLEFASEEAKHIHLFRRFREEFLRGFGTPVDVIGPPDAVARAVLAKHPLAVALLTLHIEWMTQRHWLEAAHADGDLDPMFKSLLKHHWMEEAQHARLDEVMVDTIARRCTEAEIARAVDDYLALGGMFDEALAQQITFDLAALEAATGASYSETQREQIRAVQLQANRWTFLGSGMTHPRFVAALERLAPFARDSIATIAPAFC